MPTRSKKRSCLLVQGLHLSPALGRSDLRLLDLPFRAVLDAFVERGDGPACLLKLVLGFLLGRLILVQDPLTCGGKLFFRRRASASQRAVMARQAS